MLYGLDMFAYSLYLYMNRQVSTHPAGLRDLAASFVRPVGNGGFSMAMSRLRAAMRGCALPLTLSLLAMLVFTTGPAQIVRAAGVTVNDTVDETNACATSGSGTCSLRDAVSY